MSFRNQIMFVRGHFIKMTALFNCGVFTDRIRIDASSICQLKCPLCQLWGIREGVGEGYLKFDDFKEFVDRYPNFKQIELSNSGEIFLNPQLKEIIKYSYSKNIDLTAYNGVNLNTVSEDMAECLGSVDIWSDNKSIRLIMTI